MKPVPSTAEILMCKVLDQDIDKMWIDWAVEMLMVGYDTEHLLILAGITLPCNQFYLQELTAKILDELQLDHSDKQQVIKNYACLLIKQALKGELTYASCLSKLNELYLLLYDEYSF